jgi:RNA-directed DNA polymerase
LVKSWYARLLAVRRISQDNRGKHTAGIDGVQSLTPAERWRVVNTLRLDSTATPLRRTWIPKRGSAEKRPLGIPTHHERAQQTLVRQALEPEWEAKLSPHTSGFRPGRSCWDVREAIFNWMKARPQFALTVDIQKCFDRTEHDALLAKTQASPVIRRQRKAWLKAGIMEEGQLYPTTAGTPQGGTVVHQIGHGRADRIYDGREQPMDVAFGAEGLRQPWSRGGRGAGAVHHDGRVE